MLEIPHEGLDYDLAPFMAGVILALVSDRLIRIREVAVLVALSLSSIILWSLAGNGAPGLAGLLQLFIDYVEEAVTSGFLIGITTGKYGVSLILSVTNALKPRKVRTKDKKVGHGA